MYSVQLIVHIDRQTGCHMNLCLENVILTDTENIFIEDSNDGSITINPKIITKLTDFSKAEIFERKNVNFDCKKFTLLDNIECMAPKLQSEEMYDARAADCWSLGMMLFHATADKSLTKMLRISKMGIHPNILTWTEIGMNIESFAEQYHLKKHLSPNILSLVKSLLIIDESERMNTCGVLHHPWFKNYYEIYSKSINNNCSLHNKQLEVNLADGKYVNFPYYTFQGV